MIDWPTRVLVATDGSEDADRAVRAAVDISEKAGAELHMVHTWQMPTPPAYTGAPLPLMGADWHEEEAEKLLIREAERVRAGGLKLVWAHLRKGQPAEEVAALAEEIGADLIVVGSRGLGTVKRLVMGSVSEGTVRLAPCPVLVLRGGWPPSRVVVGDDSSEEARRAGELGASIGSLFGASMLLVRGAPGFLVRGRRLQRRYPLAQATGSRTLDQASREAEEELENQATELESTFGVHPQIRAVAKEPSVAIQDIAAERDRMRTLVAVGCRGLGAAKRAILGSVSTSVLRAVDGPVLIVPDT